MRRRRESPAAVAEAAESLHAASSQAGEVAGRGVLVIRGPAWAWRRPLEQSEK